MVSACFYLINFLYCELNPRDWVRGLYKPALSDAKASLSDGFGAFCIVIIPDFMVGVP